ncbi:hypothetical protein PG996_005121 [Apiospora saccharicola]|uniref:Myb-like domain-containing protein n=1 Tax=Apiospora saccharicola TaxID=335842 RepID=A0ABR1VKK5_9PEZI
MPDQSKKSENVDPVGIDEDEMLLMTILDCQPESAGLKSNEWGDQFWTKVASISGMSVPEAKRIFEEAKQQYYAAERGEIPIKPRIEHQADDSKSTGPSQQAGKEKDPKQSDA